MAAVHCYDGIPLRFLVSPLTDALSRDTYGLYPIQLRRHELF